MILHHSHHIYIILMIHHHTSSSYIIDEVIQVDKVINDDLFHLLHIRHYSKLLQPHQILGEEIGVGLHFLFRFNE